MPSIAYGVWLLAAAAACQGMVAYDCQHPDVRRADIDTMEPGACPNATSDFLPVHMRNLQLVQTETDRIVKVTQCQVTVTRTVTSCWGKYSFASGQTITLWDKLIPFSKEECLEAANNSFLTYDGKQHPFTLGHPEGHHYFSHGRVDDDGTCHTDDFMSNGRRFKQHYEETTLNIHVKQIQAVTNRAKGTISFPSGVRSFYDQGEAWDAFEGRYAWEVDHEEGCLDTLSEFWRGAAAVHRKKPPKTQETHQAFGKPENLAGSVVMIGKDSLKGQHIGLLLDQPVTLCQKRCHQLSNLPGFVVCFSQDGYPRLPELKFKVREEVAASRLVLDAKLRSDLQFIIGALKTHSRFESVVADVCETQRQVLFNKIQSISFNQNSHSLMDVYGPGHLVTTAGAAAAYVTKCVEVEVRRTDYINCTTEIPVRVGPPPEEGEAEPEIRFMNPLTRVLSRFPTIVTCSSAMPVKWKIANKWWCSSPGLTECRAPDQLSPTVKGYHTSEAFTSALGAEGLYSEQQLADMQEFIDERQHREAVLQRATTNSIRSAHDHQLGSPLNQLDIESVGLSVAQLLSPFYLFQVFGLWTQQAIGAMTLFSIGAHLVNATIAFFQDLRGVGWDRGKTIGRLCTACCGIVWIPTHLFKAALRQALPGRREEPTEEEDDRTRRRSRSRRRRSGQYQPAIRYAELVEAISHRSRAEEQEPVRQGPGQSATSPPGYRSATHTPKAPSRPPPL